MRLEITIFRIIVFVLLAMPSVAQTSEDVLLKAMKDELDRNMKELKSPDLDKPFFMMYGITDQKNNRISASMGAIVETNQSSFRYQSTTRILVGDYEFNDESLDDDIFSDPSALDLDIPLDDDYWGIRRAFWASTDNVYRSAARHFNQHKMTLKESKKTLEELPHRSFVKGKPTTIVSTGNTPPFDHAKWEENLRKLSAIFLSYPEVEHSMITVNSSQGHEYLINSEGVVTKVPFNRVTLIGMGQSKNEEGEMFFKIMKHDASSMDELPTVPQLQQEIKTLIENLKISMTTPKFEEEYYGPVLLVGNSVASVFNRILFTGRENLMATDELPTTTGYVNNSNIDFMINKIGKNFLNESISIIANPTLKVFNGVDLIGSYDIDAEGFVPSEVVLVENGILKNLLDNRTRTNNINLPSGYANGPGVLKINYNSASTFQNLKSMLIEEAKKEGLEYAIMVRDNNEFGFTDVIRVYVADGKEEVVRNAVPNTNSFKVLRNILDATKAQQVVNLGGSEFSQFGEGSFQTSFIVPEAMLLRDIEIQAFSMPSLVEEQYVKSPRAVDK